MAIFYCLGSITFQFSLRKKEGFSIFMAVGFCVSSSAHCKANLRDRQKRGTRIMSLGTASHGHRWHTCRPLSVPTLKSSQIGRPTASLHDVPLPLFRLHPSAICVNVSAGFLAALGFELYLPHTRRMLNRQAKALSRDILEPAM